MPLMEYINVDALPKELVRPRDKWRFNEEGHVVGAVDNFRIPRYLVPVTHQRRICYSMGSDGHEIGSVRGIPGCATDGAVWPWFSHFCLLCGTFFIRDFIDPRFCTFYATCYDCLPKLPWASCPTHYSGYPDPAKTSPPKGLNPREYSEQEIADAFSFLNE